MKTLLVFIIILVFVPLYSRADMAVKEMTFTLEEVNKLANDQAIERSTEIIDSITGYFPVITTNIHKQTIYYRLERQEHEANKTLKTVWIERGSLREEKDFKLSISLIYIPGLFLIILGSFLAKEKRLKTIMTFIVTVAPIAAIVYSDLVLTEVVALVCLFFLIRIFWKKGSLESNLYKLNPKLLFIGISLMFPIIILHFKEFYPGLDQRYLLFYAGLCLIGFIASELFKLKSKKFPFKKLKNEN
jgi:hypothetical protein